jgi:uncharacterized repeat protein (TIGR03803 family)
MKPRLSLALHLVTLIGLMTATAFGQDFQVLHSFASGNDASAPVGQLTIGQNGRLYGTAVEGGSTTACNGYGCGAVFELAQQNGNWHEAVLANFSSDNSAMAPYGPLVLDSAGNIYGVGANPGVIGNQSYSGQLFELALNDGSYTTSTIHYFLGGSNDAGTPNPGLVEDSQGNFYGSSGNGGEQNNNGVVFRFSPNADGTWTETLIYSFGGDSNVVIPYGTMAIDSQGNLYGTTIVGGAYGLGSVYKLSLINGTWSVQDLYDFPPTIQGPSYGGIALDSKGNLYVVSQYGGSYGVGSIFKLTPTVDYWKYSLIHSFTGSTDGGYPGGSIAIDNAGNIYGTTLRGGLFGSGTVYKFAPEQKGWKETVIHNFPATEPLWNPQGVIRNVQGNLYGITSYGGKYSFGTAYEITGQ